MKKIARILIVALLVLLCTGCGEEDKKPTTPTTVPTKAPTATTAPTKAPTATTAPTKAPTATPALTKAPTATTAPTKAPTATPTATPVTPSLSKAEAAKINADMLTTAVWRARLLGKTELSISASEFVFSSVALSGIGMQEEIERAIVTVLLNMEGSQASADAIKPYWPNYLEGRITYVTEQEEGVDLDSTVAWTLEEENVFGSREYFQFKKSSQTVMKPSGAGFYVNEDLTDEEYAQVQLDTYNFFLQYALQCDAWQPVPYDDDGNQLYADVTEAIRITYEELAEWLANNKMYSDFVQQYEKAQSATEKKALLNQLCMTIKPYRYLHMCFWLAGLSVVDEKTIEARFEVQGIYKFVYTESGELHLDKTNYKTIAEVAKEVDDKLNEVVAEVVDPRMSPLAKEFALFHYCDTYLEYDDAPGSYHPEYPVYCLGDQYAIFDNPYTIGAPVDEVTGVKDAELAHISTQEFGVYTTAMTGWGCCVGHAKFFQALCLKVGIRCEDVSGANHRWNTVRIDGKSYLVDVGKRSSFPHFNITADWADTHKVLDSQIFNLTLGKGQHQGGVAPIPLYQAGYTEDTTLQDGEWIYYINFDDNGSLYKVKVDGTGNEKVCDSGTTIEKAFEYAHRLAEEGKAAEDEEESKARAALWKQQWQTAQYGKQYRGEGYTQAGAIDYRWAVASAFSLKKTKGYRATDPLRPWIEGEVELVTYCVYGQPIYEEAVSEYELQGEVFVEAWYAEDFGEELGVVEGFASIGSPNYGGDTISHVVAIVDGAEYVITDFKYVQPEADENLRLEFSFRLPTDRRMDMYDLEIRAVTAFGAVATTEFPSWSESGWGGLRESYLWKDKYYTITGVSAENGQLFVVVQRYTKDGAYDGESCLVYDNYQGEDDSCVDYFTQKRLDGIFSIVTDSNPMLFRLVEDERVAEAFVLPLSGVVCIYNVEEYLLLARMLSEEGLFQDAVVQLCSDLDFSTLAEGEFLPIGTEEYPFMGEWYGNGYKMTGLNLDVKGDASIFAYAKGAKFYDVSVCDSTISGTQNASIFAYAEGTQFEGVSVCDSTISGGQRAGIFGEIVEKTTVKNTLVERVTINGYLNVGTVAIARASDIREICLNDVKVSGSGWVGGVCGTAYGTTISGAEVYGASKIAGANSVGGIVGEFYGDDRDVIRNCFSEADVTSTGYYTGGIVGLVWGGKSLHDSMNCGDVSSTMDCVGGIAGAILDLKQGVSHVENFGTVEGRSNVGGIVGNLENSAILEVAVNNGDVVGADSVGGLFGRISGNMKLRLCASKGEITGEENVGEIGGAVMDSGYLGSAETETVTLYNTLYVTDVAQATEDTLDTLFGSLGDKTALVMDDGNVSYDCGRLWYRRSR